METENEVQETETAVTETVINDITVLVDNVTMNATQFETLTGAMEETKQEITATNEQLGGVWLLLAMLVVFEFRRMISGIREKIKGVRNV